MLCDKNIGSANKLPLAWQEEFGVGAPSSWKPGLSEGRKEEDANIPVCIGTLVPGYLCILLQQISSLSTSRGHLLVPVFSSGHLLVPVRFQGSVVDVYQYAAYLVD
jgi:hypothetical protein